MYGKDWDLRILCAKDSANKIIGILPLCSNTLQLSKIFPFKILILENFGFGDPCYDMLSLICESIDKEFLWNRYIEYISDNKSFKWDIIYLHDFVDRDYFKFSSKLKYVSYFFKHNCFEIMYNKNYPLIINSSLKSNFIKQWNILKKNKFKVEFKFPHTEDQSAKYMDILIELLKKNPKKKQLVDSMKYLEYLRNIAITAYRNINYIIIKKDGIVFSINIQFFVNKSVYGYQSAYDLELSKKYKFAFGKALFFETIYYFYIKKYRNINLLRGNEPYKINVATHKNRIFDILLYNTTLRSFLLSLLFNLQEKYRNARDFVRKTRNKYFPYL